MKRTNESGIADQEFCNVPVALTIAGSDCSAGAGLQADLKTFSAFGVFGLTAVTCVVAEVPGKVSRLAGIDPGLVREQIELCLAHFPVGAIKTGLLFSTEIVEMVVEILQKSATNIPLVVDPVMVATSGDALLRPEAIDAYRERLFSRATLVTPNMAEAAIFSGRSVRTRAEMRLVGMELAEKYGSSFLIKGGHLDDRRATDLLCRGGDVQEFDGPFISGVSTHGTGCSYAAAIAARLALGDSLAGAVAQSKDFVTRAIRKHFVWRKSGGQLHALNHFR
ncbi:MAG TPA: bifunctional hydroxymethylpyrimidine kinase/phosphomethylpyrimidine kinase [Chthoniobacterales bacterium]